MTINLRKIYLYLFSVVGLILMITGSVSLVNLGLKTWVFTEADKSNYYFEARPQKIGGEIVEPEETAEEKEQREAEEQERQEQNTRSDRQRQAANAVAQLIIGIPVFAYHWRLVNKEKDL